MLFEVQVVADPFVEVEHCGVHGEGARDGDAQAVEEDAGAMPPVQGEGHLPHGHVLVSHKV